MESSTSLDAEISPITVTVKTARKLTGLGNTSVWKLIKDGRFRSVQVGKRRLIYLNSIKALLASSEAM